MASESHRSTIRVLDIMETLSASENGLTLTEIAEKVSAPKSSIFPIIHTLLDRKYLELNEYTGKYSIGLSIFALCASFLEHRNIYNYVLEEMKDMVSKCSEACQLGILEKNEVLYIGKVDSPQPVRMASHVGTRLPANCASLGKALISDLNRSELEEIFEGGMKALTDKSIVDMDRLCEELENINKSGIAQECEEVAEQIRCFAVPLRKNGKIKAAIGVTIPLFRVTDEKIDEIRNLLFSAQMKIEKIMKELDGSIKMQM